jgi:hypothetical protein
MTASRIRSLLVCAVLLSGCPDDPDPGRDAGDDPTDSGGEARVDSGPRPEDDGGTPPVDAGPLVAPIFRNEVDMADGPLAREALRIMGSADAGGSNSCNDCHAISRELVRHFYDLSTEAWATCFADLALATPEAAMAAIDCFREGSLYTASNLGVFSAGGWFEWFRYAFRRAYGDGYEEQLRIFRDRVAMPPASHPALTQAEFDIVTEWFLRGTPMVEEELPPSEGLRSCTGSYVNAEVLRIVEDAEVESWTARNRGTVLMHGCSGSDAPIDCLDEYPLASSTDYGAEWDTVPGTAMRILYETAYNSSYWTRSSADGRFVAHGGGTGSNATIIDLERDFAIGADALYDPGFFPDNSGFVFHGTPRGFAACEMNVLLEGDPTSISFGEDGCSEGDAELYEHVGASLDGADYYVVNSTWSIDPGRDSVDPPVYVNDETSVRFYMMLNGTSGFTYDGLETVNTPYQANAVISPSANLLVTQLASTRAQNLGYVLHRVDVTTDGGGDRDVSLTEIARYCVEGGKPAFSLDDRWLITHHRADDDDAVDLGFTGPDDPGFDAYRGISNVYLIDLTDGTTTRITNMQPGQDALFPHFRSDGWIYILVRDGGAPEYIVASDAALVLGAD